LTALKKRLLILVDWFAPGYKAGGPIQSCVNLSFALKDLYDVYVLTTDTDHGETIPYKEIVSNEWIHDPELGIHIYYANKRSLGRKQISKVIVNIHADYIYLNLLFSPYFNIYPLWMKLKGNISGKVILCPRGSLYDSALSLRSFKKKPLLILYKWMQMSKRIDFHATNEREKKAIEKYFPNGKIIIADNLPNILQHDFISREKNPGYLDCIFIARIVPIKNLLFLLNILKTVSANITLTIVGPAENAAYWNECKTVIDELPENIKVINKGAMEHDKLRELILQNHLFVLPTTGENFGHAIFEAFLSGRPVLISDQTPWLHLEKYNAGWDLSLHHPESFASKIEMLAECNQQEYDKYSRGAWMFAKNYIDKNVSVKPYQLLFS
jgi:glycosyltransferase involved in cell wall biosynthesis